MITNYLEFHHCSIVGWMHVRQKIENPDFNWNQLDSDRQQIYFANSDIPAGKMLNQLQIEDPQTIIDMYSFLLNSCFYNRSNNK